MPQHRITLFFGPAFAGGPGVAPSTAGDLHGWSESYYRSVIEADAAALAIGVAFSNVRRRLLSPGWRINSVRVSVFPQTRAVLRQNLSPTDGMGIYNPGNALFNDESAYDAIIINITSLNGHPRALSMRGIGNEVVTPGAQFANPPLWQQFFPIFSATLAANFAVRFAASVSSGSVAGVRTVDPNFPTISPATPGILSAAAFAPVPGAPVRIANAQGMAFLNGLWIADVSFPQQVIGGATYSYTRLKQKRSRSVIGAWTQGGTITALSYQLDPMTGASPGYGTSRRTGSFPLRPRGRRSIRRS